MDNQLKISKFIDEPLYIHFGGDSEIDAVLLSNTIKNFVDIVEVTKDFYSPETDIQLKVKTFKNGSFEIHLNAIFEILSSDKLSNFVNIGSGVIALVIGLLRFGKFLKGKKPKIVESLDNEENVKVLNIEEETTIIKQNIYNVYELPRVSKGISNVFEDLTKDNTRTSFRIASKNDSVKFSNSEYANLSNQVLLDQLNSEQVMINKMQVFLDIKKPDLGGKSQWQFYFNKVINATIEDEEFLKKVVKGDINFSSKDKLKVMLRMEQDLEENGNIKIGTERYFIEKVLGTIREGEEIKGQMRMNY